MNSIKQHQEPGMQLSLVIPVYNDAESLQLLYVPSDKRWRLYRI